MSRKPTRRTETPVKLKKQKKAPAAGNEDEPLGQKAKLEKVLETEQEDRPYSREELLALEQTRGFSSVPVETYMQLEPILPIL